MSSRNSRICASFLVPICSILLCLHPSDSCAEAQIDPKDPPEGLFSDEWAEIYIGEGKVGYAHSTMTRDGDRIETRSKFHMKLGRDEQPIMVEMNQQTTETVSGEVLGFGSNMDAAVMKTEMKGTVKDGKLTIVSSQLGMEQTQNFDFPPGALMAWGLYREGLLQGFKPGTQYEVTTYAPELRLDAGVKAITKVGEWEEFEHNGKKQKGQKVTVTLASPIGEMEMMSWVDERGLPLKAKVPAPGLGDMVLLTADQKTALADFVPPEMFNTTTIKANRKIDREKAQRISYRVELKPDKAGKEPLDLPQTHSQTVAKQTDGSLLVRVVRQDHSSPSVTRPPLGKTELAEYLESNLMMNLADLQLVDLAKKAKGETKDPYTLADNLRKFVTSYVSTKSLNIGFGTASEVARTKEGDCSEHGVLLAALGRLNGLPSRVAVGLAYVPVFGQQDDIFGYHLWTQFYIDGRWLDVDAALRETQCSPIRVTFAVSSLHNAGLVDLSLPLINKIGAIDLKVVDVDEGR